MDAIVVNLVEMGVIIYYGWSPLCALFDPWSAQWIALGCMFEYSKIIK
jgi:hypothetical protein